MKFFRLDLLTMLISLFIFSSCKNQDTIGLKVDPLAQVSGSLVDTATITTNTVREDSVQTYPASSAGGSLAKNPLGYLNDPIFGITTSDIATDLDLPLSYTAPGGTVVVDSALLVLRFADGFYGGDTSSTNYTINVFQLKEKFIDNAPYYNTKKWSYDQNALLGSKTFTPRTHDSIKINRIITGKRDTLIKVPPQVRIPISTNFINTYLFGASTATLGSITLFQNAVKGIYLTLDKTKITGPGGIFMIKSDTLAVYYRSINGATIDTAVVYLPVSGLAAATTYTYSATILAELDNKTPSSGMYLQGLGGLRTKISFPKLLAGLRTSLLQSGNDMVINRAEIVITMQPNTYNISDPSHPNELLYSPLPKLTMYRLDIAHQRSFVEDADIRGDGRSAGVTVFGGRYNPATKQYHFVVTAYMQDLLLKRTIDYGTYIAPIDTVNTSGVSGVDVNPTVQTAARSVAVGGANKGTPYSIKLNIIYTKVPR